MQEHDISQLVFVGGGVDLECSVAEGCEVQKSTLVNAPGSTWHWRFEPGHHGYRTTFSGPVSTNQSVLAHGLRVV